jgi:putative serine protease PepD
MKNNLDFKGGYVMNRRNTSLIAGLGCLAIILLIVLPIAFVLYFFGGNIQIPNLGSIVIAPTSTPALAQSVPQINTPQPGDGNPITGTASPAEGNSNSPQIPQTGNQAGNLAEPVIKPPASLADLYDQANPGAVSILVTLSQGGQQGAGAGSGFVITDNGYIITNDHVVQGADTYIVRFYNNVDMQAKLIGADPDSDLAVLKVDKLPQGVKPLPLGDSKTVRVGDSVVAIGNPFALGTSMSYGIVSAIGRTIPSITPQFNIPEAIQTDAAINPGNSGGPLINMKGEIIGINAQIQTSDNGSGGQGGNIGIGFAIPVNILKLVYPSLIQSGTYTWPYLGVASTDGSIASQLDPNQLQAPQGAFITDVVPSGPAAQGGLQPNDVVTAIDGQKVTSFEDLLGYIAYHKPGDTVTLTVTRGGQQQDLKVTLGERPKGNGGQQ